MCHKGNVEQAIRMPSSDPPVASPRNNRLDCRLDCREKTQQTSSLFPPPERPVARIEPTGPAFGRPDDKLREIRERPVDRQSRPGFSLALNPGYTSTVKSSCAPNPA